MNSITIAICEDNSASLAYIRDTVAALLPHCGCSGEITCYPSSAELSRLIDGGKRFHLYFLDIDMPKPTGLELAAQIRRADRAASIMFISSREEYVFEAIKARPFRFVRKSHFKSDLKEALAEFCRMDQPSADNKVLTLEVQSELYRFYIPEILYVQAKDNYLDIVTEERSTLIRYRISDLEKQLEQHRFLRIHKSYLVSFSHIHLIHGREVILKNEARLPISRYRLDAVREKFKEYMQCS